ncbi:hypothetical protein [Nesterenkonia suensis]
MSQPAEAPALHVEEAELLTAPAVGVVAPHQPLDDLDDEAAQQLSRHSDYSNGE